jgi:glucose/arabinose dehydrogenase
MPGKIFPIAIVIVAITAACAKHKAVAPTGCDTTIQVPAGFCATVFAESIGPVRHIVVRKNGDVIAAVLDQRRNPGGVIMLRDEDHDGHSDQDARFGDSGAHGLALAGDSTLYVSTATAVLRYHLTDSLGPKKRVDTIVTGLSARQIPSHSLAIDFRGNLIVNIGATTNACQSSEAAGVAGRDPCPELATAGGIWSFRTDKVNQRVEDGTRIATGLHNAVALAVNPGDSTVYAVSHGRDALHEFWPAIYSEADGASGAAEEMIRIAASRADFGWPYCYYDYLKQERLLAPEYGGEKTESARCDRLIQPLIAFPPHWAPMALLFYTGSMFPPMYRSGAFIAFHGSAHRSPFPEEGYHVVFLEFKDGIAAADTVFATGFAGGMMSPEGAAHRPTGLAQGPDGALYISDDKGGRIWKIIYKK